MSQTAASLNLELVIFPHIFIHKWMAPFIKKLYKWAFFFLFFIKGKRCIRNDRWDDVSKLTFWTKFLDVTEHILEKNTAILCWNWNVLNAKHKNWNLCIVSLWKILHAKKCIWSNADKLKSCNKYSIYQQQLRQQSLITLFFPNKIIFLLVSLSVLSKCCYCYLILTKTFFFCRGYITVLFESKLYLNF